MTPDEIRNQIWVQKFAVQAAELVAVLTDLNVAQQRIKALEEAAAPKKADVLPIKKESE